MTILFLIDLNPSDPKDNGDVHSKSVALLRNLLTGHDLDPRYSDPECKAKEHDIAKPSKLYILQLKM